MDSFEVHGLYQAGVLVSSVDECLRLFRDALGMKVVLDVRHCIQPAKGLSGVDNQVMNVLMLRGEGGADLEIHEYVDPPGKPHPPLHHSEIGSMHFMLRVTGIEEVVSTIEGLGYTMMIPITTSQTLKNFKYAYFRGPDEMMVELQEGTYDQPR